MELVNVSEMKKNALYKSYYTYLYEAYSRTQT